MIKNGWEASYIGDGVYAYFDYDTDQIWIYTSNGIEDSEPIALNDDTMIALNIYAKNHFSRGAIR